jgi:TetR/AcrR family transcriptional regulator, cholesterol catabolism regulator
MKRDTRAIRKQILVTAAQLFRRNGFHATSMNDISAVLKLSKPGMYHHFRSKDEILFQIMNHAMEMTEQEVVAPVQAIADPEEKLRSLIRRHVHLALREQDREITVILHENHALPPSMRKSVNSRKKRYIHFVEGLIRNVQDAKNKRRVAPKAAAFALLGMINWLHQWYKPGGSLSEEDLVCQFTEIFFSGAFA